MVTRTLHFVLILSLLSMHIQAAIDPADLPYKIYLPMISNRWPPHRLFLPLIENRASAPLCQLLNQTPADGAYFFANAEFDTVWAIKNIGQKTWLASSVTIDFTSGDKVHNGPDMRELPYDVSPGAQLNLTVHMTAPSAAGRYTANWALREGSTTLCQFFIGFMVG